MKVTIIGTGKAGSALAFALKKAGFGINALVGRNYSAAVKIGKKTGCSSVYRKAVQKSIDGSDIILISVEDSNIKSVSGELGRLNIPDNAVILHTSGVFTSGELKIKGVKKANLGSFHPVQTIPFISLSHSRLLEGIY